MGLLDIFSKKSSTPLPLPSGTFSVDRNGQLTTSTLQSAYPKEMAEDIGRAILKTFREAQEAQLPLNELNVTFGALKIKAREMRGGAMIFLSPREQRR